VKKLKSLVKGAWYCTRMFSGYLIYLFRRETPAFGYHAMVGLFCLTGGRSNDFMSRLIGLVKRPYRFHRPVGVLGDMTAASTRMLIVDALRRDGYVMLPSVLPPDVCQRLLDYSLRQPSRTRVMDNRRAFADQSVLYDRKTPAAVRYDFSMADLLANTDVQQLLADQSLVSVAQDYLGARPSVDVLAMWWHTAFSDTPDSEAAQYFHFDMDRPKWLKCFIYLTDVTKASGPHIFVAGSHRTGGIPRSFLERGYVRLMDDEVDAEFGADRIIEFVAPRGTIILEDTRGLHKGAHVRSGDRLMLQIQFSNSLFGGTYPRARFNGELTASLREAMSCYPKLYSAFC
jgi:hypothetical protein